MVGSLDKIYLRAGSVSTMLALSGVFCAFAGLAGCDRKNAAPAAPTPVPVTVAAPVQREVIEWDTYTGYLEAPEVVNIAARVSGMITEAPFTEGAIIKKGQLLFVIDDRPFKADLDAKLAELEKAESQEAIAQLNFNRREEALKTNAVSQQDYDTANANLARAKADVSAAKAAVEASRLNFEWCRVTSPVDGRVSSKWVTVGNLVNGGAGQATMLTSVQSVNPMYCYVDVDEHSVLKYQRLAVEKKRVSAREGPIPCFVQLGNETGYPHAGVIDFLDNHINQATGTLRARGVLENPTGLLLPGFFARLRVPGSGRYQALLVPDAAIGNDQNQRNVLVVNKDNTVEVRPVKLGAVFGELRSITSGLGPEDRVIINGQMRVRPGSKVAPTEGSFTVDLSTFADPGPDAPVPLVPAAAPESTPPAGGTTTPPANGADARPTTGSPR